MGADHLPGGPGNGRDDTCLTNCSVIVIVPVSLNMRIYGMSVSEEFRERLLNARTEVGHVASLWRFIVGARAILLVTTSTAIGTVMNMYHTGLAEFKTARITETGQVISVVSSVPSPIADAVAILILASVFIAVVIIDFALSRIEAQLELRGSLLEKLVADGDGIFTRTLQMDHYVQIGFLSLRLIACVVVCAWIGFFLNLILAS